MAIEPEPGTSAPEPFALRRSDVGVPRMGTDENALPAETASSEVTPEASSDIDSEEADYQVVKVFYGTDRQAATVSEPKGQKYLGWFYLTVLSAVVTVILAVVAFRFARRLPVFVLAGIGVAATVLLGVATTVARLQGEAPGPRPERTYGNDRGELEMGTCEVSIPSFGKRR